MSLQGPKWLGRPLKSWLEASSTPRAYRFEAIPCFLHRLFMSLQCAMRTHIGNKRTWHAEFSVLRLICALRWSFGHSRAPAEARGTIRNGWLGRRADGALRRPGTRQGRAPENELIDNALGDSSRLVREGARTSQRDVPTTLMITHPSDDSFLATACR